MKSIYSNWDSAHPNLHDSVEYKQQSFFFKSKSLNIHLHLKSRIGSIKIKVLQYKLWEKSSKKQTVKMNLELIANRTL